MPEAATRFYRRGPWPMEDKVIVVNNEISERCRTALASHEAGVTQVGKRDRCQHVRNPNLNIGMGDMEMQRLQGFRVQGDEIGQVGHMNGVMFLVVIEIVRGDLHMRQVRNGEQGV